MIKKRYLVALGALAAAITACGSDIKPGNGANAGTTGGPAGGTTGQGGSSGTSGNTSKGGSSGNSGTGTGGSGTGGSTAGTGGNAGVSGNAGGGTGPVTCQPGVPNTTQVPRMLNRMYDAAVRDLLGVTVLADGNAPSADLVPDFDGAIISDAWRLYQQVGSEIAHTIISGASKTKFINCDATQAACLTQAIKDFGRKAFRRPMSDTDATNFATKLSSITPKGTSDEIAEAALYTFLVPPSFLLIPELDATQMEAGAIKLSDYEVAARLSFLLWNSVPDADLNTAADNKALETKDQILAQAQRMINIREKTGPMVSQFHRVNFALDNNTSNSHWWKTDHTSNTAYQSALKPVYRQEMDMFFEDVAFSGGSFKDLFLSNVAFVNNQTAAIYGLDPTAYTADLTRVELDKSARPGFMTRIGFLSSFAHGSSTSPILRGAYVTVNMIGADPGPPNPDNLKATVSGTYATERLYVEALTSSQDACKGCHIPYVNPPGFLLENFDSIGAWQTTDPRGGAIDTKTTVVLGSDAQGNDIKKDMSTPLELMQAIGTTPKAQQMYAQKWVAFATGRDPNNQDACSVDKLNMNLSMDGYSVLDLLADLTQTDSFRLRTRATP